MYQPQAILLRVTPSRRAPDLYAVSVTSRVTTDTNEPAPAPPVTARVTIPYAGPGSLDAPGLLTTLLAGPNPAGERLVELAQQGYAPILLDLRAPRLQTAPWEGIATIPPLLNPPILRSLIRYSPVLDDLALVPLELPIDVLVAELGDWSGARGNLLDDPLLHPLEHFRSTVASNLDAERLRTLLHSSAFDVVHLRGQCRFEQDVSLLQAGTNAITADDLRRLLAGRGRQVRLVILETSADAIPAALVLAHRVLGTSGPTVIVADTAWFNFPEFYYDLTHDISISSAFVSRMTGPSGALLMARGGDQLLQISDSARALRSSAEAELDRARAASARLGEWIALDPAAPDLRDRDSRLQQAISGIENIRNLGYSFEHESGGLDPMTRATSDLQLTAGELAQHRTQTTRVVNTWFQRDDAPVPANYSLAAGETYLLRVMIGPPAPESNLRQSVAIPEDRLAEHYRDDGLALRVLLFSSDFELLDDEGELTLPPPPFASQPVDLRVVAPHREGRARLRVAIYFQNNLLQSIVIDATIAATEGRGPRRGNAGEVEWALSSSLRDVERFGDKTLSLFTNETANGTHLIAVVGSQLRHQYEFGETELFTMIDEARQALQWVCGDPAKKEDYRFEPDNRGKSGEFREFLSGLAELGYDLYYRLIVGQDDAFEAELAATLAKPATIQAAALKSAKFVFPWALVYDHPVVPHPTNQVCPDFSALLATGPTVEQLSAHTCFVNGCAYRDDTNVVCPSGFWGFRHVVEQPLLSRRPTSRGTPPPLGEPDDDAVDAIPVPGTAALLAGFNQSLKSFGAHRQEISTLPRVAADIRSDLFEIGKGLQRPDLHLVYFYCHGGHKRGKAWLGVGAKPPDMLYPTNLPAWKVNWARTHPLIFVNGCNTAAVEPDDLTTFNEVLTECHASGVIGSEIAIPETFGRAFGSSFLNGFVNEQPVGDLVRRIRLEFLAGYNLLGLAYTPYCLARLQLHYQ